MASKAKGLSNKIGDLWNKGKTKVKNDFIEAGKAFRYAMKKMGEYVPKFGGGPIPVMEGAGKIPSGGKNLLKDAYQYMKDTGGKVVGSGEKDVVKGASGAEKLKDISKLTPADIPTAKSSKFNEFFNSLSSAELDEIWKNKELRKKIERQLRAPGGLHEWHLVSRAPQFKFWDISAEQIKDLRTAISDVKFVNPKGVHGGLGSTKAHNELLAIIDTSNDYNTFIRRMNNWANYRLEGGIAALPEGLRLK